MLLKKKYDFSATAIFRKDWICMNAHNKNKEPCKRFVHYSVKKYIVVCLSERPLNKIQTYNSMLYLYRLATIIYVWTIYHSFRQSLFLFRLLLSLEKPFIFLSVCTGKNLSTGFTSVIPQLLAPVLNKAKKPSKYRIC